MKKGWKQKITGIVLTSLVLFSSIVPAGYANAQGAVSVPVLETLQTKKEIEVGIEDTLLAAALAGLMETANYFMRKLAYDTAIYVANGGKGQGALIFKEGFGSYLGNTARDAAASGLGELGKSFGVDLCNVPDLRDQLFIQLGLRRLYAEAPKPNCTWNGLFNGGIFDGSVWNERYGSQEKLLDTYSANFDINNTDFGIALKGSSIISKRIADAVNGALKDREEGQGFKAVTDLISGNIKTPGQTVQKETEKLTQTHQGEVRAGQIAGIYGSGALEIIPSAAGVFLNTLTSELLNKALKEGLFPSSNDGKGSDAISEFGSSLSASRAAAELAFNDLLIGVPARQLSDFPIVAEMASCPDNPSQFNCVIDGNFQRLLAQADSGNPLTIREALDQGLLQKNWPLISPRRESEHSDIRGCQVGKYCYSNVQKLRKARIVPLGFEIAALRSDPELPWTLGQVVDNFETCSRNANGDAIADVRFPFCHLINPNWVIRAPAARCEFKAPGPELAREGTPIRAESCIDLSTCIDEGPNGTCKGTTYSYCTKEKNVWHIPGDLCEPWQNTCKTFTNTGERQVVSYLSRTLDYGQCNSDNKGCTAYSLERNAGEWVESFDTIAGAAALIDEKRAGRNQTIYFNDKVVRDSSICSNGSDGCNAFFTAVRTAEGLYAVNVEEDFVRSEGLAYIQKAPDYLGCYDINRNTPEINWPTTIQEVENVVSQDPACNDFASVCVPEEIGCELYSDVGDDQAPQIPGIIGEENVCPAVCVGYDTFKQLGYEEVGTGFEDEKFPLYFIPNNAAACSADVVGCDEFTNLDVAAAGGESLEYYTSLRYCEKPEQDGSNIATFYTWEGSSTDGFVLRTHRLLPIDAIQENYLADINVIRNIEDPNGGLVDIEEEFVAGSPAYSDDRASVLTENITKCNQAAYDLRLENNFDPNAADPDCRAMFDEDGNVYYRMISQIVTVSDACHPLRKTQTELYTDSEIRNQNVCQSKGGLWNIGDNECLRCTGGGSYVGGTCVYNTISAPGQSNSCSAGGANPGEFAGCRAYIGNAGRDVETVVADGFELISDDPDALVLAKDGWTPDNGTRVVVEAIDLGGHSLEITSERVVRELEPGELEQGGSYEINFWARGNTSRVSIAVEDVDGEQVALATVNQITGQDNPASIGNDWQQYRIGPFVWTESSDTPARIVFNGTSVAVEGQPAGQLRYYIDVFQIKRLPENLYLIKNTWKGADGADAPLACDSTPNNNLPGEMLGCRAYDEISSGERRYATGFNSLCRPKAIGCQPLWDTYNTVTSDDSRLEKVYQAWCSGEENLPCFINIDGIELGSCNVPNAGNGCYVEEMSIPEGVELPAQYIRPSTIIVPADTPDETPVFLAIREEFECRESEKGCMLIGAEERVLPEPGQSSIQHNETMIKNDPDAYGITLCRDDLIGCSEFRADDELFYFKDPIKTGNELCYYKPDTDDGIDEPYGWFLRDIGRCEAGSANVGELCRSNADCGGGEGDICGDVGLISCYQGNYTLPGNLSGIHSSGDAAYSGLVAECPAQVNGCTELVDPADSSDVNPDGKPYYVIYNDKTQARVEECDGEVSLSEGCVLFDRTELPNKLYNSEATYSRSENADPRFSPVSPISDANNDANLILKVIRDRACSEWLSCRTKIPVTNPNTGEVDYACYQYSACEELADNGSDCKTWVDDVGNQEDQKRALSRLGYEEYVTRGTSWYDEDFVGYSLYDKYQITNLVYIGFDLPEDEEIIGGVDLSKESENTYVLREARQSLLNFVGQEEFSCTNPDTNVGRPNWSICGVDAGGRCYNSRCLYPLDKNFQTVIPPLPAPDDREAAIAYGNALRSLLGELESNQCKSYPEEDSPFPVEVAVNQSGVDNDFFFRGLKGNDQGDKRRRNIIATKPNFEEVNICQDGNCSCAYKKYTYSSGITDYWPITGKSEDGAYQAAAGRNYGVCSGGAYDGQICRRATDCLNEAQIDENEIAVCAKNEKISTHVGVEGFCLEYDLSRPLGYGDPGYACLTWLPIETSASRIDIYNADEESGYYPSDDSESENSGQVYCVASTNSNLGPSEFTEEQLQSYDTFFGNDYVFPYFGAIDQSEDDPDIASVSRNGRDCGSVFGFYGALMCGGVGPSSENANVDYEDYTQCATIFNNRNIPLLANYNPQNGGFQANGSVANFAQCEDFYVGYRIDRCIEAYNEIIDAGGNIDDSFYFRDPSRCANPELIQLLKNQPDFNDVANNSKASVIARLIQRWSRRVIGDDSAVILRAEAPDYIGGVSVDSEDQRNFYENNPDSKKVMPLHLLTVPNGSGSGNTGQISYGIFRHPPRIFGDINISGQNYLANQTVHSPLSIYYEQPARGIGVSRQIYPAAYAPGPKMSVMEGINNVNDADVEARSLYRSQFEEFVRETDINKLYFLTTMIENGLDEQSYPPILEEEPKVYIDFNNLRGLAEDEDDDTNPVELRRAMRTTFCQKTGGASGANEEFPRRHNNDLCEGGGNGDPVQQSAVVWTYLLEGNVGDNLLGLEYQGGLASNNQIDAERNTVHRRYVLVYMGRADGTYGDDNNRDLQFNIGDISSRAPQDGNNEEARWRDNVNNYTPSLNDESRNPFHPDACDPRADHNSDNLNWFAIGLDFNEDGEFLGYISRNCNISPYRGRSGFPQLAVVATLNDQCVDFAQVYDETANPVLEETNKAWTDRIWNFAEQDRGHGINLNAPNRPFGTLYMTGSEVRNADLRAGDDVNDVQTAIKELRKYSFTDSNFEGVPLSCSQTYFNSFFDNIFPRNNRCSDYLQGLDGVTVDINRLSTRTNDNAEGYLYSLFAKTYARVGFDTNSRDTERNLYILSDKNEEDRSLNFNLRIPSVYSINPYECGAFDTCGTGEADNITIGDRNGTLADYDKDGLPDEAGPDGEVQSILGFGSYFAVARFFAFADDNRMPIRRVKVNWGDDTDITNDSTVGLYKNRLPICLDTDERAEQKLRYCTSGDTVTGVTCNSDKACGTGESCTSLASLINGDFGGAYENGRFGAMARACTEGYFEFIHEYTCDQQQLANPDSGNVLRVSELGSDQPRLLAAGFDPDDLVCVFKPAVQVVDNWEYCNGTCDGGTCYGINNECTSQNDEAWTYYQGRVIVVPKRDPNDL